VSHLHIPDGIIDPIWLLIGFIVTGLIIGLSLFMLRKKDIQKLVPRIGIISAVMLLGMSVPLPIGIGYHLNLSVLVGIILGPWAGFISAFIVNLILALIGHGGVTVIGLNSLIIGSETVFGFLFFGALRSFLRINISALIATFFALALSTALMMGIVGITQVNPAKFLHHHEHNHQTQLEEHNHQVDSQEELAEISLIKFAKIIIPFAFIGWVIESLITSAIIGFMGRVKPDLFYERER